MAFGFFTRAGFGEEAVRAMRKGFRDKCHFVIADFADQRFHLFANLTNFDTIEPVPYKDPEKNREKVRRWRKRHLVQCREKQAAYYKKNPTIYLLNACRDRCRKKGLVCNLTKEDIAIPTHCPVLGIPLFHGNRAFLDNSPSLDRMIPELGYVRGNVNVISFRANRIKHNATLDEVERVADYMRLGLGKSQSDLPQTQVS